MLRRTVTRAFGASLPPLAAALAAAVAVATSGPVPAQTTEGQFPNGPVTIIASYSAGSAGDVGARAVAESLRRELKTPVVVNDVPGGDGLLAVNALLAKPADGQTLLFVASQFPYVLADPGTHNSLSDFTPIARITGEPIALGVSASGPYANLSAFVAAAKAHPDTLTIGEVGAVGDMPTFGSNFARAAGIKVKHIPFDSGSTLMTAVLGGHVDAGITSPSNMIALADAGKIKILALAAPAPSKDFPGIPTFAASGYALEAYVWRGVLAKAGTPKPIVDKLAAAFKEAIASPEFDAFRKQTHQGTLFLGPPEFARSIAATVKSAQAGLSETH